jgi:hypothetical protein
VSWRKARAPDRRRETRTRARPSPGAERAPRSSRASRVRRRRAIGCRDGRVEHQAHIRGHNTEACPPTLRALSGSRAAASAAAGKSAIGMSQLASRKYCSPVPSRDTSRPRAPNPPSRTPQTMATPRAVIVMGGL